MTHDDLRNRLAAANPVPPTQPVDPANSDRARALMEETMSTTTQPQSQRRSFRLLYAAAALVVLAGAAAILTNPGGTGEPLVLTAEGGNAMASCMQFDVATLAQAEVAFGGTVTELTDSVATFEVDTWYAGEEAEVVEVGYTPGFEALIGTPALEVGERYLITAAEGAVNGCGYSGPATPEYEAQFEEAFGA